MYIRKKGRREEKRGGREGWRGGEKEEGREKRWRERHLLIYTQTNTHITIKYLKALVISAIKSIAF